MLGNSIQTKPCQIWFKNWISTKSRESTLMTLQLLSISTLSWTRKLSPRSKIKSQVKSKIHKRKCQISPLPVIAKALDKVQGLIQKWIQTRIRGQVHCLTQGQIQPENQTRAQLLVLQQGFLAKILNLTSPASLVKTQLSLPKSIQAKTPGAGLSTNKTKARTDHRQTQTARWFSHRLQLQTGM